MIAYTRNTPFIAWVESMREAVAEDEKYPFSIPAIAALRQRLRLHHGATIFVGENGSGKSTLIEGIAVAAGFNPEGGSQNFNFSTRASHSELHRRLRLAL